MLNIFEIIGPVMIGPSSSHTAGAARLGFMIGRLLGEPVVKARVTLYGSFSTTGRGHGTDKAITGGLIGLMPDDSRLPDSFNLAEQAGADISIEFSDETRGHPNTADFELSGKTRRIQASGVSVGGGRIEITQINGLDVSIGADYPTVVVFNRDYFGTVAQVTQLLARDKINIAFMRLSRHDEGKDAVMVLETDSYISDALIAELKQQKNINDVIYLEPF
jgi:L-serine dehydratase